MQYTGNQGHVKIGATIIPVTSWEASESIAPIDTTHMDSTTPPESRTFISDGLRTMTGGGVVDLTDIVRNQRPTLSTTLSFELRDKTTLFYGNLLVTSNPQTAQVGEKVSGTFEFQTVGTVLEISPPMDLAITVAAVAIDPNWDITFTWLKRINANSLTNERQVLQYRARNTSTQIFSAWAVLEDDMVATLETIKTENLDTTGIDLFQFRLYAKSGLFVGPKSNVVEWVSKVIVP